jgi:hypothetical protein
MAAIDSFTLRASICRTTAKCGIVRHDSEKARTPPSGSGLSLGLFAQFPALTWREGVRHPVLRSGWHRLSAGAGWGPPGAVSRLSRRVRAVVVVRFDLARLEDTHDNLAHRHTRAC